MLILSEAASSKFFSSFAQKSDYFMVTIIQFCLLTILVFGYLFGQQTYSGQMEVTIRLILTVKSFFFSSDIEPKDVKC